MASSTSIKKLEARIGGTIAGKYRINRLLGTGAIGAVYAAIHQFTGKHVALKIIDSRFAQHDGFAVRFLREARAAGDIGHPVIVDVLDAGREPDGSLYLALELLEGRTLEDAIELNDLRLDEIVEVAVQLLDGLSAAHARGIVHRDIKPGNVFLTWDERGDLRVKLIDFGVAKRTNSGPEMFTTQQGAILGTPYYMAPEQAAGDPVDNRADVWGVGAVLFHVLSGQPPFNEQTYNQLISRLLNEDAPSLGSVRAGLPSWLVAAVDGALRRDLGKRWQSARVMRQVLLTKGAVELDLDWEAHEDATVRTEGLFGEEQERPPTMRLLSGEHEELNIEVNLTSTEMAAVQIDPEPAPDFDSVTPTTLPSAPPSPNAQPRGFRTGGVLVGLAVGVLVTVVVMLAVGWALFGHLL